MRSPSRFLPCAFVLLGTLLGCRGGIDVRTMSRPDASFSTLKKFRVLTGPLRRDSRPIEPADDPMLNNSIANRALRERLVGALQDRGYVLDSARADFGVAFYTTSRERVDPSLWDYGYPFYPDWPRYSVSLPNPTHYLEGTVVVDVVTLEPRRLLWRGTGVAELSSDPGDNVQRLVDAVAAIVTRFPRASETVVAVER